MNIDVITTKSMQYHIIAIVSAANINIITAIKANLLRRRHDHRQHRN